jgi:hypothetical protein
MQLQLTIEQAALIAQLTTAGPSPTAHPGTTPDATTGAGNTPAAPPPPPPAAPPVETTLATPPASAASTDGAVSVEIPLRITLQLGTPCSPPPWPPCQAQRRPDHRPRTARQPR